MKRRQRLQLPQDEEVAAMHTLLREVAMVAIVVTLAACVWWCAC